MAPNDLPGPRPAASDLGLRYPPPPPEEVSRRDRTAFKDFGFGLVMTVVILLVEVGWQRAPLVEWIHDKTQEYLQQFWLSSPRKVRDLPVAILDITRLETTDSSQPDGQAGLTPRGKLFALVQAVADQRPAAIGIDVDFSPVHGLYRGRTADPPFFERCLRLREEKHIPVYVGVYETRTQPPAGWLGLEEYQTLAASIDVPINAGTWRMPLWVRGGENPPTSPACRSLCAALADEYRSRARLLSRPRSFWPFWQYSHWRHEPGYSTGDFLVDYSALTQLSSPEAVLRTKVPSEVRLDARRHPKRFVNKVVLIGNASLGETADTFRVADEPEPIPGVLVHACALNSLLKAHLYEWTPFGRFAIDLLLSLLALFCILAIRRHYNRTTTRQVNHELLHRFFFKDWAVAIILALGLLVRWTGIVWDDAIIVAFALWIHPPAQFAGERTYRYSGLVWRWALRTVPAAWHRFVEGCTRAWIDIRSWLDNMLLLKTGQEAEHNEPSRETSYSDDNHDEPHRSA